MPVTTVQSATSSGLPKHRASTERPTGWRLVLLYSCFAAIATAINIAVQAIVFRLVQGPLALPAALIAGTVAGLPPKYILDKRWIFIDQSSGHIRKFSLYTIMSGATTLVFWGVETLFDYLGHGGPLHYLGAVVGLGLGYWIKYRLDSVFVFRSPE